MSGNGRVIGVIPSRWGSTRFPGKSLHPLCGKPLVQWVVEGAAAVIAAGYMPAVPECVRAAIETYRGENDWLSHFLDDCCELEETAREKSGELYSAYRGYCLRRGEFARSTTDFYRAIDQRGFDRRRTKAGSFVIGLRLNRPEYSYPD